MLNIVGSLLLAIIIGYLWGSLPSGYWMGKLLRGKDFDIRNYGSHKTGATNVLRTLGKGPAAVVFLLDISKGIGPTLIALLVPALNVHGWGPALAGIAALIGHCYPIFIGFKGGRGVMTGGGGLLVISPLTFFISMITTFSTIAISRYVSLGSIVGSATSIVCGILFFFIGWLPLPYMIFMVAAPALVIILHYDNIQRLLAGKERKIGQKEVIAANAPTDTSTKVQA